MRKNETRYQYSKSNEYNSRIDEINYKKSILYDCDDELSFFDETPMFINENDIKVKKEKK